MRSFTYNGQVHANHNHLMSRYPGMDGIKTGFINKSGFNLAASAVRDGHRLVGVVFGGPSAKARDSYMASLLDAAFRRIGAGKGAAPAMVRDHSNDGPITVADAGNANGAGDQDDDQDHPVAPVAKTRSVAKTAKTNGRAGWVVQLGSFKSQAAGRQVLNKASRHIPAGVGHPAVALHKVGSNRNQAFRAQLVGFKDEHAARLTCARVQVRCTVAQVSH
jgi:D-alanyl-D-alanine carboxypeptidase